MKKLILLCFVLALSSVHAAVPKVFISKEIFKKMPFSTQYKEDGALIMNVNHAAVKALIPQLNSIYQVNLEDRKESHITILTPPEFKDAMKKVFTIDEIIGHYGKHIQNIPFGLLCVGYRKSMDSLNQVFYLVVKSPTLFNLRTDLYAEAKARALKKQVPLVFRPEVYSPHITIGYVGNDVHDYTKGPESCLPNLELVLRD